MTRKTKLVLVLCGGLGGDEIGCPGTGVRMLNLAVADSIVPVVEDVKRSGSVPVVLITDYTGRRGVLAFLEVVPDSVRSRLFCIHLGEILPPMIRQPFIEALGDRGKLLILDRPENAEGFVRLLEILLEAVT